MRHFFAFLSRMKYINRWGLMRNTSTESIAVHSLEVSQIAHGLAVIKNVYFGGNLNAERAALLALYHDACETITGDMPTPVKYYNPGIKAAYGEVESIAKQKLLSMLPPEMEHSYRPLFFKSGEDSELWAIVKAADKIAAYIKCVEERRAGNCEFKKAEQTTLKNITDNHLSDEVRFFMEHFMESYSLTLDEQD